MKFLCVACDTPMKLVKTAPPERGSLSVTYECPECFHAMAMLTNPFETQLVTSLGVKIGPQPAEAAGAEAGAEKTGCPFAGMVEGMTSRSPAGEGLPWTPQAEQRLVNIPEFVRPMARQGIEQFARDRGAAQVDETLLDEAKAFFGM
jgi:hypothetical protein